MIIVITVIIFSGTKGLSNPAAGGTKDSLLVLIENGDDDTLKVNRLFLLSRQYDYFNSKERLTYAIDGLELAYRLSYSKGITEISPALINQLFHRNMNDLALAYCYEYMGWLGESDDSIRLQQTFNIYANLLSRNNKFPEAFKFYNKALAFATRSGDEKQSSYILTNLSILMLKLGKPDSALLYTNRALDLLQRLNDASALNNCILGKAEIYLALGDTVLAQQLALQALEGYTAIDVKLGMSNTEMVLGEIDWQKRLYQSALGHFNAAFQHVQFIQLHEHKSELCKRIAACLSKIGRFEEAFNYQLLHTQYNDSAASEVRRNNMMELEVKYEIAKKETELQEKITALDKSRIERKLLLTGIGAVLLLLGLSVWAFWNKKKSNVLLHEQKLLVEEKQQDILDSIHYAHRIQQALLTYNQVLNDQLTDFFVLHRPKDIVSGDFYWACFNENGFYVAVCDSTGHGVPGAFMSLLNSSLLNEAIREKQLIHPDEIFNYVRLRLIESITDEQHKDGFDGILLRVTKDQVEYAAAGNAPVIIENSKYKKLSHDRMPVSKSDYNNTFTRFTFQRTSGTYLYLFTDGYADQFGGGQLNGKKFKYKRLYETLEQCAGLPPMQQKDLLGKVFENWKGNYEQVDDVLILGIEL